MRGLPPVAITAIVFVVGFALCTVQFPNFASTRVAANLLTDNAFLGIVATGMTFVIISGGIDLSVGSVIGFTTVFVALAIERLGMPPLVAFAAILLLCAALAGVIAAADIMGADANNAGLWLELDAILAVVIGGTSLFGGRFSLVLAMVGALIIQAMNTGILLSGYPPEFNLVVKAAVVLIVLLLQSPRFANAGAVLGRARQ